MRPRFEYGDEVRVTRNVRNDGTYPGEATGALLVRRGSVGYVRDVGTFLQDQLIYTVHFLDDDRLVGCRDAELQDAADPWVPSRFEFREHVTPTVMLAVGGEVIARPGDDGEVLKVLRDGGIDAEVSYHVRFPGRTLQVPEGILRPLNEEDPA